MSTPDERNAQMIAAALKLVATATEHNAEATQAWAAINAPLIDLYREAAVLGIVELELRIRKLRAEAEALENDAEGKRILRAFAEKTVAS